MNPLGRISDPLERLFNFQNLVLSGSPRSEENYSARTKSARADVPNRSDGFVNFSGFLCFAALDLILALVFPTFVISKYNFLSGALPLGTPRAVSAARPHFLIVAPYSQFGP